ncbi:hypothetical protein MASR2M66_29720 [Chloroflexota bacterium]
MPINETDVPETDGSLVISPKSENGVVVWKVLDYAEFPLVFNYELISGENIVDYNSVIINVPQYSLPANKKGTVTDGKGRVKVDLPPAAIRSPMAMDIRYPSPNALRGNSLTWNPVEIIAVDTNTQKNITKFNAPITISIQYDEQEIFNWDERDLTIFYYDPQINDWFPIETTVDTETNTLTAQSDHLTVFDYKANNWQSTMLPTVDAFKTADFTGAATYQINMWTPPAPGGLQPTTTLSYNSQIIDEASAYKQASWAGMGWDMDTGAVTRNMHGTDVDISDDTYYVSVGGVSGQLIPIGSNPNNGNIVYYNTADQAFMKVESHDYSPSDPDSYSFIVWTKDGTRYDFKETIDVRKNSINCNSITWRWSLSKVTDVHGNTLDYTYYTETKNDGCNSEIAVYPETITYGNGKYRVNFVRGTRTDYQVAWASSGTNALYGTKRLNEVQIQHNAGGGWTNIRRYVLSYAPNTETVNIIYPNFAFSNGGKTLTLVGIQEYGADGSVLPAVTFTYGDNLHLTSVNNGQGGVVTMTYTPWSYLDHINDDIRKIDIDFTTADCSGGAGPSPVWSQVFGTVRCDATKRLQVGTTTSVNSRAERAMPENLIKPSARYWYKVNVSNINGGNTTAYWGFTDGTRSNMASAAVNDNDTYNDQVQEFTMGVNYNPATTKLRFECSSCFYRTFELIQYATYYRVTSRSVTIQPSGVTSTYTYKYDNGAPVSTDNSAAAAAAGSNVNLLYVSKTLGEYRGNAMSMMTNPQGLTTVNWFWQADGLKGRNYDTLNLQRTFFDDLETLNSNWAGSGGTHVPNAIYERDFDNSIKTVNGTLTRNASLGDNKVAVAHIRLTGTGATGQVGLVGGPVITLTNGSASINGTPLLGGGNFKLDEWYVVMFFTDSVHGSRVRIWQLDNPNNSAEATVGNGSGAFYSSVANGTIYTDSYFEGIPYSESITRYEGIVQYDTTTGNSIPDIPNSILMGFKDLGVTWVRVNSVENRNYNGDAAFVGTKQDFTYESSYGNMLSQTESGNDGTGWALYRKTEYEYHPNTSGGKYIVGLPARQVVKDSVDTLLAETLYFYDGATSFTSVPTTGNLTTQRIWAGGTDYTQTSFTYDSYGNPTAQTVYTDYGTATANPSASSAQTTTTIYDTAGYNTYPISVTNQLQQTVVTDYNYALGVPFSVTDANTITTTATYDGFGRLKTITAPGDTSPTLSVTYWDARIPYQVDLVQSVSASSAIRISRFYDGAGREIQSQTANAVVNGTLQNVVVDTQYNNLGQAVKKTTPYLVNANSNPGYIAPTFQQSYTETFYDVIGRATNTIAPNQTSLSYTYYDLSTISTDPKQNPTQTFVDVWGRTTKVVPPTGPFVEYTYDVLNRLTDTDRAGNNTHINYDTLGRKINMDDPDMGYWQYEYDALGNLVKQIDAKGQTVCLVYDDLNRLDGKSYPMDGICSLSLNFDVNFNYDETSSTNPVGRRTSMSNDSGSTKWDYDPRGRLSTETKTINGALNPFITSWAYNSGDLPVQMNYPDGETIVYTYNTDGTLMSLISQSTGETYLNDMQYDEAGRLKLIEYGDNVISKTFNYFSWDTANMGGYLSSTTTMAGTTNLQNLSYTYDQNGNVLTILDALDGPETQSFTYDVLNRIKSASATGGLNGSYSESYEYDPLTGNLSEKSGVSYTYEAPNNSHGVSSLSNGNSYLYDANGNMTNRTVGGSSYILTYDLENRLTNVAPGGVGQQTPADTQTISYNPVSAGSYLAAPVLQSSILFEDGFESGNLGAWNNSSTDGGDLSVSNAAAAIGSNGMQALIDDTTSIWVKDQIPTPQSHYSIRFYFDPNSVNVPNDSSMYIVTADADPNGWAFCLELDRIGDGYALDPCVMDDANVWHSGSGVYITDGWQAIEMEWQAASASGANDGYLKLWVNDVLVETLMNLDTDTLPITDVTIGAASDVPANTTGTIFFDGFVSNQGEHIGLDPNGPALTGPLTNLIYIDGFESSNLDSWGDSTTDGGDLSVDSQAAAVGGYGMQVLLDDTINIGVNDYRPNSEAHYSARFYFDPNSVVFPTDENIYIFTGDADPNGWAFCLELSRRDGNYTLKPCVLDDTNVWHSGEEINIIDGWQAIELEWQAASAPGANDGYLKFWINDVLVDTLSNLDTDTLPITDVNLGVDFGSIQVNLSCLTESFAL